MEIWQELSNFQTTSQRLANQFRTIMKKGWFSELEIIEIQQKYMIKKGVMINYVAHQILTNKNSPSKMNHQRRKMEIPPNQTLHNKTTQNKH